MIGKWHWQIRQAMRQIWVRAVSYACLGVLTALIAIPLGPLLPEGLGERFGADAVDRVLGILASSMLAVTTFSLSIMASALAAASNTATPRVTSLLYEDRTSQTVLASFIGAFLFSLVGLITLQTGVYDRGGRFILFLVTIAVVVMIVISLLRWTSHLMEFGRMSDAIARVEAAASRALHVRRKSPFLGGRRSDGKHSTDLHAVKSPICGYIQHIDMERLQSFASEKKCHIRLDVLPGSYLHPGRDLLHVPLEPTDEELTLLCHAFTVGKERNFDQDPRFGLIVLSEIASRALSPSVNDPGTAISVIARLTPVLLEAAGEAAVEPVYPDVYVPPINPEDLFADAFLPIARDGAALVEVGIRLLKALRGIVDAAPFVFAPAAPEIAQRIDRYADRSLHEDADKNLVMRLVRDIESAAEQHAVKEVCGI